MSKRWVNLLLCVAIGFLIWYWPAPEGVKPIAWHLLAIFVTTIMGFILQPFTNGVIAFMSITFTILVGVLKPAEILSGFGNTTLWLIVSAFLFSRGFINSGLGRRVAYLLIRAFGDSTLKLGYVLVLSELIFSPAIPSNTARIGGIIYPIVRSLSSAFGSEPGKDSRKIGAYLIQTSYQGCTNTSAMFMTAQAGNPLMAFMAAKAINVDLTWGMWAIAAVPPGLIALAVIPYLLYKFYPPEIKKTPEAKELASAELGKMGPMSSAEKIVVAIFSGAIIAWSTSQFTGVDATAVVMCAICVMLGTGILTWNDVLTEKGAWDTLIWMGSTMALADYLAKLGLIAALAGKASAAISGLPWTVTLLVLVLVYVYSHYMFASGVAHILALYAAFITVGVAAGIPPYLIALSLAVASSLYQGLTHYASGQSPIFFGAGFIDQKTWWRIGFAVCTVSVLIWGSFGPLWWKLLGLW